MSFVFFSRIHPSKNLMKLVRIWKRDDFFDYTLDIYGEVEDVKYFENFKDEIKKKF